MPAGTNPGPAAVSTSSKVKRTPVILNVPRKPAGAHFRVLQWNVLADGLAQSGGFIRVPPNCLEWEYRKPRLLQEILEADADIICLQELNHFEDLRQELQRKGYEGAFREKHASPALKYEFPPDGMAVFFRSRRFSCSAGGVEGRSFQDTTGREQSQGYLQILLHDQLVGRDLLVVTTHLKAKDGPECEDVRHQQAGQLLRNVASTTQRLGSSGCGDRPGSGGGGSNGSNGSGAAGAGALGGGASANGAHGDVGRGGAAGLNGNGRSNGNGGGGSHARAAAAVPVLVTGDFNTLPDSKTCRAFREHPLGLLSLWEHPRLDAALTSSSDGEAPAPGPAPLPQPQAGAQGSGPAAPLASAPACTVGSAAGQQEGANGSAAAPAASAAASAAAAAAGAAAAQQLQEFSTWKFREKGESKRISDYIWFSGCGALRPLQRWRMLTEAEIGPTALPSTSYASDHVSLCCEFEWDVDADLEWAPTSGEPEWG